MTLALLAMPLQDALAGGAVHPKAGELRRSVTRSAARLVGVRSLKKVNRRVSDDCTGLVRHVFGRSRVPLSLSYAQRGDNGVTALWRRAQRKGAVFEGRPRAGDLVFFRETYDRNRDGRRNDGLTHVGIVTRVLPGGAVEFVHRANRGVVRDVLDPRAPRQRRGRDGRPRNVVLRNASRGSPAALTGELFVGYASAVRLAYGADVRSSEALSRRAAGR